MKLAIWWARRWPEAAGGARGDPGKRRFAGGAVEGAPRACIRTQSAAARSVRVGGTERNARPPRGIRRLFSWPGERFACQDASRQRQGVEEERLRGGAGAPASAEGAHGEAGQAETGAGPGKATGKRRASGGAWAPVVCFRAPNAIATRLRNVLVFDSRADTSRHPSDAFPADTGPLREG